MSNVYYLTNVPYDKQLNVGDNAHFYWDGKDTLVLTLRGGRRSSTLHFKPGDAFKANQEGHILKLSRLEVPATLSGVVLWACHVEKAARVKDEATFLNKLGQFKSAHRILEPEPGFSPVWKSNHRIKIGKCTGPFLFMINEEKLHIARYAKHKGTMWATVAAYCASDITRDEAKELIRKYGVVNAPQWYISNAIDDACNEAARKEEAREQPPEETQDETDGMMYEGEDRP